MHDIKFIRDNPDAFDQAMKRRGLDPAAQEICIIDGERRSCLTEMQSMQETRNEVSRDIGEVKQAGGDISGLSRQVAELKSTLADLDKIKQDVDERLTKELLEYPNILDDRVPDGDDENDNEIIRYDGEIKTLAFPAKDHVALGEGLGMMDFSTAAKLSGSRFVILKNTLARFERAIAAFMLDVHTSKFGYTEYLPPFLVKSDTMQGTGQLPKFADDLFQTTDERWLIPTAEVPLTNMVAGEILDPADLPLRLTAYTPCFRAEAGSAGRDTRGMIRQHQFSKVELVSITRPDKSDAELERMLSCAEEILKRLALPYRVVRLCSGDTGFSASMTYDIEVWLPGQDEGQGKYREISSCSNCGAFQARRMKARFRETGKKETQFVHTLNGSGLAVGRTMIAILENYQNEDGSISIPEQLKPYMNGFSAIERIAK